MRIPSSSEPGDATSDHNSVAGTPAPRSTYLGSFLGIRDVKRTPIEGH